MIWACLLVSAAIVVTVPSSVAIQLLVLFSILRTIVSCGPEFTLTILGLAIVRMMKIRSLHRICSWVNVSI